MSTLAAGAEAFGVSLNRAQLQAFERYRDELLAWNKTVNLTAITEPRAVEDRHFLDSLSCLLPINRRLQNKINLRLIDIGAGAGFPGLPIKLARPEVQLTLVDSVGKKTAFLRHLVEVLGLSGVQVITARAEDLARSPEHREHYEVAVARAVASLPVLLELCLPFVRVGGLLVAPRRGDLPGERQVAGKAVQLLGGRFASHLPLELGAGREGSGLVVVEKIQPTSDRFPRRAGIPAKRPLA